MGHGEKSVILVLLSGLELTDAEMLAMRWHMGAWGVNMTSFEDMRNYDAAKNAVSFGVNRASRRQPCRLDSGAQRCRPRRAVGHQGISSRLFLAETTADDECESAITGHVACQAEAVHSDIQGYHKCLGVLVEAEHRRQNAQRRHYRSAGNSRSGHHRHAKHKDETCKHLKIVRNALHYQRQRARNDFQRAARQMYRGAQRHHKSCHALIHAVGIVWRSVTGMVAADDDVPSAVKYAGSILRSRRKGFFFATSPATLN